MRKIMVCLAALAMMAGAFLMGNYHGRNVRMPELRVWVNRITEEVEIDADGHTWRYGIDFRDGYTADEWMRSQFTVNGLKQH